MKKICTIIMIFFCVKAFCLDLTKNYIQVYGEGPKGRIPMEFEWTQYSEKETVLLARTEALELLSGLVYGYKFVYKVENPLLNENCHFDLTHIYRVENSDPNIRVSQLEEAVQFMRVQVEYRLNEDQKLYINGFRTKAGPMTMGTGYSTWTEDWSSRLTGAFKNALKDAVLNAVRKNIQSRPQYITGKIMLRQSPRFTLVTNKWQCDVKADLIIDEISYREQY